MTRSSYHAWRGVIGRVLPKPEALMREALSETLPVRIATGEIRAYLPVSSDEGMATGSGTSLIQDLAVLEDKVESGGIHIVVCFTDYGHGSFSLIDCCIDVAFEGEFAVDMDSKVCFHVWEV